jgi:solute carrier family 25 carnitine/acylcarnitine transporter 20/29
MEPRTSWVQITRLVRGTDANNPKPLLAGIGRLYRGYVLFMRFDVQELTTSLGVSMARSMLTHGLLWTIVDAAGNWIDTRPLERWAGASI